MKLNALKLKVSSKFGKAGLVLRRKSPEIFLVVGTVGVAASAVMAYKATMKVDDILDHVHQKKNNIEEAMQHPDLYNEKDKGKDLTILYVQTAGEFVKTFAPAVLLGTMSVAFIFNSHRIMRNRNIALATAYAALDKGFKQYRKRVIEDFGEEVDYMFKHGLKKEKVKEKIKDEETGKTKTVTNEVVVADFEHHSVYSKFFDEYSPMWSDVDEYNRMFLEGQQSYANDILVSRGYLFLNDVYDMLGIPRTKAGNVVGWIKGSQDGDGFVDFGLYTSETFINGYEKSILLDFNVDGVIIEKVALEQV